MRGVVAPPLALAGGLFIVSSALAQAPGGVGGPQVYSQSTPAEGTIGYPAAFFADFRPTSAFDMVARVPGFTFAAGANVRGFAGAAGNVLIDGERPSSKSVSLEDALKRIAPQSVERLELIRGGAPGIDMQGQPVVVNVVRRNTTETTASVDHLTRLMNGRAPSSTLRIEGSRRTPATTLEGTLYSQIQPGQLESGHGIFTRHTGAGAPIVAGQIIARGVSRDYQASGAAEYRRPLDTFRLTAGISLHDTSRLETTNLVSPAGVRSQERSTIDNVNDSAEIGGDYQRRLTPAVTARLIGLYTANWDGQVSTQQGRGPFQLSDRNSTSGETILRGVLTVLHPTGITLETGAEGAFNYLDSSNSLTVGAVPVVLPSATVRVEERRGEGFVTASLKPTARLSLESGVRIETSVISQSGDVTREKTFTFVKPRFIAAFAATSATQMRFRLERTVGQLRFEDFAASSDLSTGLVNAGNADLEPDRTWLTELTLEQRFWGKGAVVLTYTHRAIEQVVDVVPVFGPTSVFSAPGNIGDGRRDDLKLSLTLPLDRLRLPGGQIRFNATARRSEVTDPVTGLTRPISLVRLFESDFTYTQDIPAWKSTFTLETGNLGIRDRSYRINEIQTLVDLPVAKATWQYRPRPDLILALAVENLLTKDRNRHRIVYSGTRASGIVTATEYRSVQLPPWISLRLRRTF